MCVCVSIYVYYVCVSIYVHIYRYSCIHICVLLNFLGELKMSFKHNFKNAVPFLASTFEFTSWVFI